jgi:hypothetical protein
LEISGLKKGLPAPRPLLIDAVSLAQISSLLQLFSQGAQNGPCGQNRLRGRNNQPFSHYEMQKRMEMLVAASPLV